MGELETMSYAEVPEEARKTLREKINPRNWKRKNKILTGLVAAVLGIGTCTNAQILHNVSDSEAFVSYVGNRIPVWDAEISKKRYNLGIIYHGRILFKKSFYRNN